MLRFALPFQQVAQASRLAMASCADRFLPFSVQWLKHVKEDGGPFDVLEFEDNPGRFQFILGHWCDMASQSFFFARVPWPVLPENHPELVLKSWNDFAAARWQLVSVARVWQTIFLISDVCGIDGPHVAGLLADALPLVVN